MGHSTHKAQSVFETPYHLLVYRILAPIMGIAFVDGETEVLTNSGSHSIGMVVDSSVSEPEYLRTNLAPDTSQLSNFGHSS